MKDRYHGGGFEGMKRAVGNSVAGTEVVKNNRFASARQSNEFAPLTPAEQVASAKPPSLPPRAPLVASPTAVSTLTPPVPVAAQASAGGGSWAGGSQTLPPVGASTTAQEFQMASNTSNVDRSQSSQTHIGDLHVHTAATDAAGIAKSIKGELKRYDYVSQVDTGLV